MFREIPLPPPISLAELVIGRTDVAIALHGYYDATGSQATSTRGAVMGLAGYAATPQVWESFESLWWDVLSDDRERPACRYLHMTDAMALQGEFSCDNGWTENAVTSLIRDLFNRCFSPHGIGAELSESVVGAACAVDIDAYDRVCKEQPHFAKKKPEALCVDHVVTYAIKQLIPAELQPVGMDVHEMIGRRRSIALFFDRNEPFRHHILRVYEALPWHRRPRFLRLIGGIGETDRESSAAIQAADFLAWHMHRWLVSKTGDLNAKLTTFLAARCYMLYYDYAELLTTAKRWREDGGYEAVPE